MVEHKIGPQWLNDAIFYEIYPQSFRDTTLLPVSLPGRGL